MNQSSCSWTPRVHLWHDGELPQDQADQLQRHLTTCRACADELAWLKSSRAAWAALPAAAMSADWVSELETRMAWSLPRPLMRLSGWLTAAAAVLAVVSLWPMLASQPSVASTVESAALDAVVLTTWDVGTDEQQLAQWHLINLMGQDASDSNSWSQR